MTIEEFMNASLESLASLSGLDKTRWSKYLNGQVLSEKTLSRSAERLSMSPEDLLAAINQRRRKKELGKEGELHSNATYDNLQKVAL